MQLGSYVYCEQCDRPTRSPLWLRYEPLDGDYRAHCRECATERDRQLTAENAICAALIIIGIHQGKLGVTR